MNNLNRLVFITKSEEETIELGRGLGGLLEVGVVVALIGELGAGKTTFVKGVAKGLGVPVECVRSPSFIIMNEYAGRLPLYHFDLYRFDSIDDIIDLHLDEYFYGDGVSIIEWADKGMGILPDASLFVRLSYMDDDRRLIQFSGNRRWKGVLEGFENGFDTLLSR